MSPDTKGVISSGQLRAARALLRMSGEALAEKSGVSLVTIRRAEAQEGNLTMMRANMEAIRRTLEAAGIEFIDENGDGAGVRLCKPRPWRLQIYGAEAEPSSHEAIRDDEQMLLRVRDLKAAGKLVRVYGGTDARSEKTLQALRELGAEQI